MTEQYHIVDEALPTPQDFKQLKEESLAYLQEFSGNAWTNFNPSDPGITILDQLCFALTELGYCIDFPMKDILSGREDRLIVHEQFYRPEQILTTTPVTLNDFRKYIIDGIDIVKNALIVPRQYGIPTMGGVYDTYLYVDLPKLADTKFEENLCQAARYQFTRCRNLGESFTLPKILEKKKFLISGSVDIESKQELEKIFRLAQQAVDNFIFPTVKQYGYEQLKNEGIDAEEIFDGPKLHNGWIKTEDLGTKKDELKITDLITVLDGVEGILSVNELTFESEEKKRNISSSKSELIQIDLLTSLSDGHLSLTWKGKVIDSKRIQSAITKLKARTTTHNPAKTVVRTEPKLPEGKHRKISEYYSIQNTFPEIFGVGENSIKKGASDYRVSGSRQLKGYLTLFDQVIANEFEQLSNLDKLFSFKNADSPAPHDLRNYLERLDELERENQEYPVPYLRFSPSYFCQSLYDIPHISPLLKDSNTFDYSIEIKSEGQQEIDSWQAYQDDPFNPYIHGMMDIMEDEDKGWERRNDILDHVLARHGESPYLIDEIIAGSEYSLSKIQNQVIFKSLYLQNLAHLSYYRCKAYNYLGARKINEVIPKVTEKIWHDLNSEISQDFVFQSHLIDRIEHLSESDFDSYSAIELKLSLLLGLRAQYRNFIVGNYPDDTKKQEVDQAHWMMTDRRGVIMIESNLLLESANFEIFIRLKTDHSKFWSIGPNLDHNDVQQLRSWMLENSKGLVMQLLTMKVTSIDGFRLASERLDDQYEWYRPLGDTGLEMAVMASWGGDLAMSADDAVLKNILQFYAPDYLPYFKDPLFTNTFDHLMADSIAPRITYQFQLVEKGSMEALITDYAEWHNSLIFDGPKSLKEKSVVSAVARLIRQLIKIYKDSQSA